MSERPEDCLWNQVARIGGRVVGFINLMKCYDYDETSGNKDAELSVTVEEAEGHQHIGSILVHNAFLAAIELGLDSVDALVHVENGNMKKGLSGVVNPEKLAYTQGITLERPAYEYNVVNYHFRLCKDLVELGPERPSSEIVLWSAAAAEEHLGQLAA